MNNKIGKWLFAGLLVALLLTACEGGVETPTEVEIHQSGVVTLYQPVSITQKYQDRVMYSEAYTPELGEYVYPESTEAFLDLDSGKKHNDTRSEIYYAYSCGSMCWNTGEVIGEALSIRVGIEEPGYEGCLKAFLEKGTDRLGLRMAVGHYTCILTSEGRIAQVRVDEIASSGHEGDITVSFTTWEPVILVMDKDK